MAAAVPGRADRHDRQRVADAVVGQYVDQHRAVLARGQTLERRMRRVHDQRRAGPRQAGHQAGDVGDRERRGLSRVHIRGAVQQVDTLSKDCPPRPCWPMPPTTAIVYAKLSPTKAPWR